MVGFLRRELPTVPHRFAIVGLMWRAVASCFNKMFILRVGHRMQCQVITWEADVEGFVTR
jgi:hypothetical protein